MKLRFPLGRSRIISRSVVLAALIQLAFALELRSQGLLLQTGQTALTPSTLVDGNLIPASMMTVPFTTANFSGSLFSAVVQNDSNNPFSGSGGLTFIYELTNYPSANPITAMSIAGFGGSTVMEGQMQSAPGQPQVTSATRNLSGNVVFFNYDPQPAGLGLLTPGTQSGLLILETDATSYAQSIANIANSMSVNAMTWAPSGPEITTVPEPATWVVGALLMVMLVIRCWLIDARHNASSYPVAVAG